MKRSSNWIIGILSASLLFVSIFMTACCTKKAPATDKTQSEEPQPQEAKSIGENIGEKLQESRKQACHSHISIMQGAVEMYNMDHMEMMNVLDIDKLIQAKYMKPEYTTCPSGGTYSGDNLIEDCKIRCSVHGAIN